MAKIDIKLASLDNALNEIAGAFTEDVLPGLLKSAIVNIQDQLIEALIQSFERTIVIQGLLGTYAGDDTRDVQAHVGLPDDAAQLGVEEILQVIRNSLKVGPPRFRSGGAFSKFSKAKNVTFTIQIEQLTEDILGISSGGYESEGGNVEWIDWLINGGGTPGYNITFTGSNKFDGFSRTGRALMTTSFGIEWSVDDYGRFSETGINFVEDALNDEEWLEDARQIITEEVVRLGR